MSRTRWLLTLGAVVLVVLGGATWVAASDDTPAPEATGSTTIPDDPKALFGTGCAPLEPAKWQNKPIRDVVEQHPQLHTLRHAVEKAGMLDTFNTRTNLTMLLPTDAAFDKVPGWQLKLALSNKKMLTGILTYHVIEKPLNPKQLNLDGPFRTLEGSELRIKGFGQRMRLGVQNAHVLCGNIPTRNATIYFIDTVLLPS